MPACIINNNNSGLVRWVTVDILFNGINKCLKIKFVAFFCNIEVYHYLDSKIIFDKYGKMKTLQNMAQEKFEKYKTNDDDKNAIGHWLLSAKIKLMSALENKDNLKSNYLTATNSWKVIETVWAINNKPVPPASRIIPNLKCLEIIPYDKWFNNLFNGDDINKIKSILRIIDWALPLLKSPTKLA
jgi:hypothetical protein